jgi:hypothetical protein
MTPISQVNGQAIPFGLKNVDTDIIIPAAFLKTITRSGLGKGAFQAIRAQRATSLTTPLRRLADPDRGRQLRLRLITRTCGMGSAGPGDHLRHRAQLLGHLLGQCV